MVSHYIPKRGDIVWLQFNPQVGHEQSGKRPALVISPESYNQKTGLMIACPITSQVKGYPFEVRLSPSSKIQGVILADQIKNLDWQKRGAEYIGKVSNDILHETISKVNVLIL